LDAAHVGFHHGASYVEVVKFLDAVRRGSTPEVDVHQGLWSVAIGVAAHRSIESGEAVSLGAVLSM
jgi:predicted dehydrogenase